PFEGSVRQVRGAILRLILEEVKLSKEDLTGGLPCDRNIVGKVLGQLEREDIIVSKDGYISVA
ncbi:MAG: A/G-specific adenine glycosylase, partial [Deltaproteobacteria bacterium]|nr:A/G-specific adenine glycosylase [Deltaproteobacteria bacterium]